jgi:hypothetical protein
MIDCQPRFRLLTRAAAMVSLLVVAGHLGGCASMGDGMVSGAFVDPAKYDLYDCKQLETERAALVARTADLQRLIDKANTGAGGSVVGELAYRNDYISARAQAKLVEENWQRSKCVASAPAAPPVSVPAAPAARKRAGMH